MPHPPKKLLLIDLDGVLNEYCGIYDKHYIPPIKKGATEFLKELSKKYRILIFTSRPYEIAKKWVGENALGIYVEDVTSIKLPCYLHIDDRAISYKGNFNKTLEEIENFKPHWR